MEKKEKFLSLVSKSQPQTLAKTKERIANRDALREVQQIAMKILSRLDDLGWTKAKFAASLGVTPQQVTKIVSGQDLYRIDTLKKIQTVLNLPILASYYEEKVTNLEVELGVVEKRIKHFIAVFNKGIADKYQGETPVQKAQIKHVVTPYHQMAHAQC